MRGGSGILRGGAAAGVAAAVLVLAQPTGTASYLDGPRPRPTTAPPGVQVASTSFSSFSTFGRSTDVMVETMAIARGDTLMDLLEEAGVDRAEADRAIRALSRFVRPTGLQIGQEITLVVAGRGDGAVELRGVSIAIAGGRHVVALRAPDGGFDADLADAPVDLADVKPLGLDGAAERATGGGDPILERLVIRNGDTLLDRLVALGSSRVDADQAIRALKPHVNLRRLQIGQEITVLLDPAGAGDEPRLAAVSVTLGDVYVTVDRDIDGAFDARRSATPLSLAVPGITADPFVLAPFVDPYARYDDREHAAVVLDLPPVPKDRAVPPLPLPWPGVDRGIAGTGASGVVVQRTIRIDRGDTLSDLLRDEGVSAVDTERAIEALRAAFDPRELQIGDRLTASLAAAVADDADGRLVAFRLVAGEQAFDVERNGAAFRLSRAGRVAAAPPLPAQAARGDGIAWSILERHHRASATPPDDRFSEETFEIAEGDTLLKVLALAGASDRDAKAAVTALRKHVNPRRLQLGQVLSVVMDRDAGADGRARLIAVNLAREDGAFIVAAVSGEGFRAEVTEAPFSLESLNEGLAALAAGASSTGQGGAVPLPTPSPRESATVVASLGALALPAEKPSQNLTSRLKRAEGVIETSLYQAAEDAGLPNEVMNDLVSALSYDVDFQRDLRRGDRFELMYELLTDEDGAFVRYSSPLYAHLSLSGRDIRIYLFAPEGGRPDYYHGDGGSVRKALLRTPISGARVTSSFGKRKDPFLGFTKMHKGVDFGAPKGTPVLAAGDGVVEYVGKYYGYGNYVRIRHDGNLETAYAHMSKFAKGLKKGSTVEQGQIIGYVGCTGRCTGNHLHYEVLVANEQVDPNGVDLPTGHRLEGSELASFLQTRIELDRQFARLGGAEQFAAR
jgi:murein DD-endopeptidase MepM/ murein hydrolase activator NlpD